MSDTKIITKFADGIFDDNDLIIDLEFSSESLQETTTVSLGYAGSITIPTGDPLDYNIAAGDMGITFNEQTDIEGEEIVIYRSLTDSELNFTGLGEDGDQNTILISFDTSENTNLTARFGNPTVPENKHEDVDDWLDDVFDTCYKSAMQNWSSQLLAAVPPASYTSKKLFTRRFTITEMQEIDRPDDFESSVSVGITSSEETEAY